MTAFPGGPASLVSPESLNRRLGAVEFINNPADRAYFDNLCAEVRGLLSGDETVDLPDHRAPYAWRQVFGIYQHLRERERRRPLDHAAIAADQQIATAQADWDRFLANRRELLMLMHRGDLTEETARFLGLEAGDLAPLVMDPRYGKPLCWWETAGRLEDALRQWTEMDAGAKDRLPLEARVRALEGAIKNIFKFRSRLGAIEDRLTALECALSEEPVEEEEGEHHVQ